MRGARGLRWHGAVLGMAAVALAAACSSSSPAKSPGPTSPSRPTGSSSAPKTIAEALRGVHSAPTTSDYVEYAVVPVLAQLDGGTIDFDSPLTKIAASGGVLGFISRAVVDTTGIDPMSASSAMTIGEPQQTVGVLFGSFDPAVIGGKLAALGYQRTDHGGGETQWQIADDHKAPLDGTLADLGMLDQLNVVRVSPSRIVYGGATADLDAALPAQSAPLSKDPVVGGLADCLGPAASALIAQSRTVTPFLSREPIAIGIRATTPTDMVDELCIAAPDDATAQKFAAAFPLQVKTGTDVLQKEPWSAVLADPHATVLGGKAHIVQLTARPTTGGAGLGVFYRALQDHSLPILVGEPAATRTGTITPTQHATT